MNNERYANIKVRPYENIQSELAARQRREIHLKGEYTGGKGYE